MKEHDVVRLKSPARYNARRNVIPEGTTGVVVHIHESVPLVKGRIMEVEFPEYKQVLSINEFWLEAT